MIITYGVHLYRNGNQLCKKKHQGRRMDQESNRMLRAWDERATTDVLSPFIIQCVGLGCVILGVLGLLVYLLVWYMIPR